MLNRLIPIVAIIFLACAENPVSEELVSRKDCENISEQIVDDWWHFFQGRQASYGVTLSVAAKASDGCAFSYSMQTHRREDNELLLDSRGEFFVSDVSFALDVINMAIESRRDYLMIVDNEGNKEKDSDPLLNNTTHAKLWDNDLMIWGNQYHRKE